MGRHVQPLTREQCVARLSGRSVGRVSVSMGALPVVVPVDYLVDNESVVFRAPLDDGLADACHGAVIAFEVDDLAALVGADGRWSVHIVGVGSILDADEHQRVNGVGGLGTGHSEPNQLVRLHTAALRGHEIPATSTASAI